MVLNKKGFFFTVIILVFMSLLFLSPIFYSEIKERNAVQKRIQTMNNFLLSAEKDLERNVYVSGFRIIFIIEKRITESSNYISNIHSVFSEGFFNGTINGQPELLNTGDNIMNGANFSAIVSSLQKNAAKINVNIELLSPNITVTQDDPWHVKVILTSQMLMTDASALASWNKTLISIAYIPIHAFEDPLYLVNTNGKVSYKMLQTPYKTFAEGSDISNLSSHLSNHYYLASQSAPSFLDRLAGINVPSTNGIESLVSLPELSSQGISVETKSVVDYIYFSGSNPSSNQISGMPSWFRLDTEHLAVYNVTSLVI